MPTAQRHLKSYKSAIGTILVFPGCSWLSIYSRVAQTISETLVQTDETGGHVRIIVLWILYSRTRRTMASALRHRGAGSRIFRRNRKTVSGAPTALMAPPCALLPVPCLWQLERRTLTRCPTLFRISFSWAPKVPRACLPIAEEAVG